VADGGLLLVTCTDLAVLCGNYGETCWAKYSSMPLRNVKYCHEMALRILLATIANHCARYKRYIVPMLSVQVDFYVRVFVRVYTSPGEVKKTASKLGYVYQCSQCDSYQVQRACKHTQTGASQKFSVGTGPVVDQKCSTCGGTQHVRSCSLFCIENTMINSS
jgi:tRNA (guanine26-N2/guanine27-N2)-dimethyltransferase